MAQSVLVNSATRLYPVEFSIGQAAGVVGSYAVHNNVGSVAEMLKEEHIRRGQSMAHDIPVIKITDSIFTF